MSNISFNEHTPIQGEIKANEQERKWGALKLPIELVRNFPDFVDFMLTSGLIYTIVGFHNSKPNPEPVFPLSPEGEPQIKVEGVLQPWSQLKERIIYNKVTKQVVSREGPLCSWTYVGHSGFIPEDRFAYHKIFHCLELTEQQYDNVIRVAKSFRAEQNLAENDCVLQFYSTPRLQLPDHPLLKNANETMPVHIGVRLITNDRKVYSLGFEMSPKVVDQLSWKNFLQTYDVRVAMLDYEEFRSHEGTNRIVTNVPLSMSKANNILDKINALRDRQLRFNFITQNCTVFARDMLKMAGYSVDISLSPSKCIADLFPDFVQILPCFLPVVRKVQQCARFLNSWIPQLVKNCIAWIYRVVTWIPYRFGCIITNLFMCLLGASKMHTPLRDPNDDNRNNSQEISTFSCLLRSWSEIVTQEPPFVSHSKPFIQWQLLQRSTQQHPYTGLPKMAIIA